MVFFEGRVLLGLGAGISSSSGSETAFSEDFSLSGVGKTFSCKHYYESLLFIGLDYFNYFNAWF